ncbi:NlpC/P60 family protein [Yinghuangia sp. YIM S09857]|uniref:C40 family peptidase n=1 Tax=Yinghuangia sp. YIM S09857 TaxID=3436929 RepID=UPI003F529DAA
MRAMLMAGPFLGVLTVVAFFLGSCTWIPEAAEAFREAEAERSVSTGRSGALAVDVVPVAHRSWVEKAGSMCAEIPPAVIAAQIEAESAWDPKAVSSAGAQGISQFMPGTWATFGRDENGNGVSPFDPADAIMAQGRYDCQLAAEIKQMQSGTWRLRCWSEAQGRLMMPPVAGEVRGEVLDLVLAAYNAGPCGVRVHRGIPPYPETQKYVAKILRLMEKYSAPLPAPVPDQVAAGDFVGNVLRIAHAQLKLPYVWGGGSINGPDKGSRATPNAAGETGFDCSGLVQYVFYQATKHLPEGKRLIMSPPANAQAQYGAPVARNDMRAGDVIAYRDRGTSVYSHIAIYIGNNQIIEAPQDPLHVRIAQASIYDNKDWMIRRYTVTDYTPPK